MLVELDIIFVCVFYGIYYVFWLVIIELGGLKKMNCNYVYCFIGIFEDGVVSGMRKDVELVVEVDIVKSLEDGFVWWKSENGVILLEGDENGVVSLKYFCEVRGRI